MSKIVSNYPFRVEVRILDNTGNSIGSVGVSCFKTLKQAKHAADVADMAAYALEPSDIEED